MIPVLWSIPYLLHVELRDSSPCQVLPAPRWHHLEVLQGLLPRRVPPLACSG